MRVTFVLFTAHVIGISCCSSWTKAISARHGRRRETSYFHVSMLPKCQNENKTQINLNTPLPFIKMPVPAMHQRSVRQPTQSATACLRAGKTASRLNPSSTSGARATAALGADVSLSEAHHCLSSLISPSHPQWCDPGHGRPRNLTMFSPKPPAVLPSATIRRATLSWCK